MADNEVVGLMSRAKREAKREFDKNQELAKLEAAAAAKAARKERAAQRLVDERARRAKLTPAERSAENKIHVTLGVVLISVVGLLWAIGSCSANLGDDPADVEAPQATVVRAQRVVPKLVGLPANQARKENLAEDLSTVTSDCSGRDRGVWNESNWYVTSQTPAAGTTVDEGTEVWLCVEKYTD